jgi:hypothetical protein
MLMPGGLPSRQLTTTQATIKLQVLHGPSISIMSAALRVKGGDFVNVNVLQILGNRATVVGSFGSVAVTICMLKGRSCEEGWFAERAEYPH